MTKAIRLASPQVGSKVDVGKLLRNLAGIAFAAWMGRPRPSPVDSGTGTGGGAGAGGGGTDNPTPPAPSPPELEPEPPQRMSRAVWRLLLVWLAAVGILAMFSLVANWPSTVPSQITGGARAPDSTGARAPTPAAGVSMADSSTSPADSSSGRRARAQPPRDAWFCRFRIPGCRENATDPEYFWIAIFAGVLGACTSGLASLVNFRGVRKLVSSWALWYLSQPVLGAFLGVILFVVLRGGLIRGDIDTATALNPYGIAALSALAGLSSDEALRKLRDLFDTLLSGKKDEPARSDGL